MELDERMEESADDITAAETAPRPIKETHYNVFQVKRQEISNTF